MYKKLINYSNAQFIQSLIVYKFAISYLILFAIRATLKKLLLYLDQLL